MRPSSVSASKKADRRRADGSAFNQPSAAMSSRQKPNTIAIDQWVIIIELIIWDDL